MMNMTPAENPFAGLLRDVSHLPPRDSKQLRGLSWRHLFTNPGVFLLLGFVLFFGLMMPLTVFTSSKDARASLKTLHTAQGQVLSIERLPAEPQRQLKASRLVKYRFRAPSGVLFYGSSPVEDDSPFSSLKRGAPVPIAYAIDKPSLNGIAGVLGADDFPWPMILIFPLFPLFFLVPLVLPSLRQTWRARRVFKHGVLTTGRVEFVKKGRSLSAWQQQIPPYEVLFSFQDESGQMHQGRQNCDNDWLVNKLNVGTPVTVIYRGKNSIFLEAFAG